MSGTSMDAIDSALLDLGDATPRLLATHQHPLDEGIRARIAALSHPGDNEIQRMGELDRELGERFGSAVLALLEGAGVAPGAVTAIGSHGQTIRHHPHSAADRGERGFTLQIGDPNTIAEITGVTTVADFRRRDLAAGGEGAPLAPGFHAAALSAAGQNRAIVNIGGIANVSLLAGDALLGGFDTGPGNTLLDSWHARHRGEAFDRAGAWAASGTVDNDLLQGLLAHPYLSRTGPRSTGKEAFNPAWLDTVLEEFPGVGPADVQATLVELTAVSITGGIDAETLAVDGVYICGGGAHNRQLMARLSAHLDPVPVTTTEALGLHPDWVEAAVFAWLAQRRLEGAPAGQPVVTGAAGARVLGGVYPGGTSATGGQK